MKKDNKFGFTLSELLIVLFIVGVIVALTLPSLLKDIRAKSNMNALTSTIDNLQKIIENELTESRAQRLQDTRILGSTEDLEAFMRELNVAPDNQRAFGASYKNADGGTVQGWERPANRVLLKNGVGLAIVDNGDASCVDVIIDVNGQKGPNTFGRDYYVACIVKVDDNNGHHMGDIGGRTDLNEANLSTLCRQNNAAACYRMAEISGFNPRYLDELIKRSE